MKIIMGWAYGPPTKMKGVHNHGLGDLGLLGLFLRDVIHQNDKDKEMGQRVYKGHEKLGLGKTRSQNTKSAELMSVIEGVDDGHKQIPDPKSPELEISTDSETEQQFSVVSDEGVTRFSDLDEMLNFISKKFNNQIDGGKQMVIDEGESQSSSTKSRKRKPSTTPCCTCPQSPAKTEEPPLPEGYGYVPYAPCVDENDRYCPQFTNRIGYMCCSRCGVKGDHWPPFCRNPVNDLPGGASNQFSWKYYLRNFDLDEYLEKQRREAEVKAMNSKSDMSRKCIHCRNKTRAETEVSAFPVGYEKPKPDALKKVLKVNGFLRPPRSALIRLMFQ